jgi:preprotein translocase subunit YajC
MEAWLTIPLAMGPAPAEGGQVGLPQLLLLIGPIFLIFYFLLIAPERKRQKRRVEMINALKNGDRVVTSGGLYGTVVGVGDHSIQLRIADKVKIEVAKQAVAGLQEEPE